jgi:predicted 2-oxoglutarate/Fe(II)-dependent dioxygenase YbiX
MTPGAENLLHYDNKREEDKNDYSGLLYLTDDYSGGSLCFPAQDIKLLPKAGTFISFRGTDDIKHKVEKVTCGNRVNIICFFIEKELND